ncbi:MAG: hypothetical protein HFI91_13785 [Lachnospiraceae bacterium]|jgi:hypothetical protein|nr:hypothetical protein [Lachnospiraceae bacterium]
MKIINQTNRTVLFDVINPECLDLINLMAGIETTDKSLTDEKIKEIHSHLLVRSFDEFLRKFAPTIYSYFDADSKRMVYTLERPMGIPAQFVKEIVIDRNNNFLKTFIRLIDEKRSSNKPNVTFNYESMLEMLSPQKTLNDMKRLNKDVNYLAKESMKLESDSPAKLKRLKMLSKKINETENFYNEFPTQIALMIGTIRENLAAIEAAGKAGGGTPAPALPYFDGEGEMKTIAFKPGEDIPLLEVDDQATQLLVSEIEERYNLIEQRRRAAVGFKEEQETGMEKVSSLMQELVVSAFTNKMSSKLAVMETGKKVELFNNYSALYNTWQKDFIKVAKPVFERILGVKAFFDAYSPKIKGMAPSLLVTNLPIEELVESQNMDKLRLYLETVNNKTDYTDTIWFGIVPRIELQRETPLDDYSTEMTVDFAEKWGYAGEYDEDDMVFFSSMDTLQNLLNGIKKYKIQTFFGFETGEESTFSRMATDGASSFMEKAEEIAGSVYDEYAIACFPNMTVVPEDKSRVVTSRGARLNETGGVEFPKGMENDVKFWMKGVYIGAEFVAAGIVAACQCPNYLKTYLKKVYPDFPGVRFDLEEDENSLRLPIVFAKEISGFTNDVKEEIDQNKFGFVFSSDNYTLDGKSISGVTVMSARSMHMDRRTYRSIFQTTRRTYIERMMAAQLRNKDERSIRAYFAASGQISEWMKFGTWDNSIIREGESVELENIADGLCDIRIESKGVSESFSINIMENE